MIANLLPIPFLEKNPVFFQIVTATAAIVLGILTITYSLENYTKKKQNDAQFGFYINLWVFLERLEMLLEKCPNINRLFFNEETRNMLHDKLGGDVAAQQAGVISSSFSVFCKEFITYISTAGNHVPPKGDYGTEEWKKWYENILSLTHFLQKGQMIGKVFDYITVDQYEKSEADYKEVKDAIALIQESLKERLIGPSKDD